MKQNFRIGTGYDIHQLVQNRALVIGGVKIPHNKGLLGHSDADVLTHAIIDALLGALALSDIGTLFPDNKEEFKNISSLILLEKVYDLILNKGYEINNIDSNIIVQEPKMMPYIPEMKKILAKTLRLEEDLISIKAKTNEKMDAVGELLAIEANAVVLLVRLVVN
ncbi:MAG: 2-C-methyl-D-erythritol 2,4-cyclodiphosphate synthase [bacterium]